MKPFILSDAGYGSLKNAYVLIGVMCGLNLLIIAIVLVIGFFVYHNYASPKIRDIDIDDGKYLQPQADYIRQCLRLVSVLCMYRVIFIVLVTFRDMLIVWVIFRVMFIV